ncbi:hypothetical protein CsSME_00043147 [Camellia sinensis var. sinensis]
MKPRPSEEGTSDNRAGVIKVMVCRAYRMSNASYCIGRGQTWWLQKAKLHQGIPSQSCCFCLVC